MTGVMEIPAIGSATTLRCDVAVVGGGTAGTMAAITAAERGASVLLLEKAHVRHSGALAMGMDGVNNAVIPGRATPEDYVAEITRANDGIINQETIWQTATRGYDMVRRLERYGVKFAKDAIGEYDVRRVHRSGSYVLPMPEGKDVKKVLYRVLRQRSIRERVRIENRVMPVRVLVSASGRASGLAGFNSRTGEFVTVEAGAVILATGACGRLGLPASGYLYGTYENPTNAGDGHAMAYHAGAELSGLECFQINPLIKDYNGPACAYVANPFGGYQVNHGGERFVDCDYWSGQMMAEVAREIASARGPIYLKLTHLPPEVLAELEGILHTTERPTRGTFHAGRGHDYRTHDVEMHISEIGLCGGHSSSGVWVDSSARTTVPGLYAAGDLACVPHNYMIGAFVFGDLAGADAVSASASAAREPLPRDQVAAAHELIYRPLRQPGRAAAGPGRVQAAPPGQRLRQPAEDAGQARDRGRGVRADGTGDRGDGGTDAARADALCRGHVHQGLRRAGGPCQPGARRVALGPVPPTCRSARTRRRRLVLAPQRPARRCGNAGVRQARGQAVPGPRAGVHRAVARGRRGGPRRPDRSRKPGPDRTRRGAGRARRRPAGTGRPRRPRRRSPAGRAGRAAAPRREVAVGGRHRAVAARPRRPGATGRRGRSGGVGARRSGCGAGSRHAGLARCRASRRRLGLRELAEVLPDTDAALRAALCRGGVRG